jgi:sugar/nucleoside kinase (ribokinase family)
MGGAAGIAKMVGECDLFGMENWTMMPKMSEIWQGIIDEVFPLLPKADVKPLAFFDLADPEKRTKEDILRAMKLIGKFEKKFRTILGLNEKEVYEIAEVFDIPVNENTSDAEKLRKTVLATHNSLGIYCLMVHPVRTICCAINGEYYCTDGPFCPKPVLTTGAGDNLNAGFCLGQSLGLDPLSSLTLGVSTSGFYVRNAKSPTFDEVIKFAQDWGAGKI